LMFPQLQNQVYTSFVFVSAETVSGAT